jgi:hypothetical protein
MWFPQVTQLYVQLPLNRSRAYIDILKGLTSEKGEDLNLFENRAINQTSSLAASIATFAQQI